MSLSSDEDRPWVRPAWLVSAGVVIIVVLLTVWVVSTRRDDPAAPTGPVTSEELAVSPPPAVGEEVPTKPPTGVSWSLWYGIALPSSPSAGPRNTDGSGYAHDPTGALVAAVQTVYRTAFGDDWRSFAQRQIVAGPGRDELIRQLSTVSNHTDTASVAQVVGFRFTSYTPDTAVLELVTRGKSNRPQSGTNTLRWVDGDWRRVVAPDGSISTGMKEITSMAGYVAWTGVAT
jgi:hypothetical protein